MKSRKQKILGLVLILIGLAVAALSDGDVTGLVLVGPLGIYMMVTRANVLYERKDEEETDGTDLQRQYPERKAG